MDLPDGGDLVSAAYRMLSHTLRHAQGWRGQRLQRTHGRERELAVLLFGLIGWALFFVEAAK